MNLKEAFRYQNKLQSFLDEAQSILDRDANITKVENTYLRRKVMAEAEDETVAAVTFSCLARSFRFLGFLQRVIFHPLMFLFNYNTNPFFCQRGFKIYLKINLK